MRNFEASGGQGASFESSLRGDGGGEEGETSSHGAGEHDRDGWLLELLDRTARFESEAVALVDAWRRFDETLEDDAGEPGVSALILDLLRDAGLGPSCRAPRRSRRPWTSRGRPRP